MNWSLIGTCIVIVLQLTVMVWWILRTPGFRKPAPPPKIWLGSRVTLVHGDTPISHMILVEFNSTFNGETEARLVDVATYEARHRI